MATPDALEPQRFNTLNPEETAELLQENQQPQPGRSSLGNLGRELEFLYDVPLQVSVEVGRARILLKDLLQMGEGYVVELDKLAGEPLDLYVNARLIARGEAVRVGDKFGIKPESPTMTETLLRTAWALLVVIGLILALYGLTKKRFFLNKPGGKVITIIELRPLQPKSTLALVEVRGREYLLGISANSINLLADLSDKPAPPKQSTDFSTLLAEQS